MSNHFVPISSLTESEPRPHEEFWRAWERYATRDESEEAFLTEFPQGADGLTDVVSRRRFLQLAGASLSLAGLTGCTRQPVEHIVPYVEQPENVVPGRPKYYATAVPLAGGAQGVIVESHLGRPTKVEGNQRHPGSLGATAVLSQASVLDLYDPDRSRTVRHLGTETTQSDFLQAFAAALQPLHATRGDGVHILTETIVSPSLAAQRKAVATALPDAKWYQFDPAGPHCAYAGSVAAFGQPVNTLLNFDKADVVLSLDADFLASGENYTRYARDFANRRAAGDRTKMNRLYVLESTMTPTGGKADHRLGMRYADVEAFAFALAAELGVSGASGPVPTGSQAWLQAIAEDLQNHRGKSLVIAGLHQTPAVHALVHAINHALGNVNSTVHYTAPLAAEPEDQLASIQALAAAMQGGKVKLLLILGGNPVYNAPADLHFDAALAKVGTSVRVGLHADETSALTHWHVPESHFLEEWSDTRAYDGTVAIQQPLILPMYQSWSHAQVLDAVLNVQPRSSYEITRATWQAAKRGSDFENWWRQSVHDGVVAGSAFVPLQLQLKLNAAALARLPQENTLELVLRPDPYLYDGRFANNAWLQELPQPMTKLTWDNALLLSERTARALGVGNSDRIEISLEGRSVEGAVWILPGQPDNSATAMLGWGRWRVGRAGDGAGFSAYRLRTSVSPWVNAGLVVRRIDKVYPLATTQTHHAMEGRDLVIAATAEHYKQQPDFVKHTTKEPERDESLYPGWSYPQHAWGMSIDLTRCVNCNACVVSCQSENNIPVVGKEQVLDRRAMHWLRIDTYYKGEPEQPEAYYQPVPCMQCENAPCEVVCPVQATSHSTDGLNDMVYNRCVGTRYCSNNCPYKVRRFNFLLYQDWTTESIQLQRNPDVTVRSRGVMEKCTYCVQRIREVEIQTRVDDRPIRDGEIQTACQQACPTQAIVFGDINDQSSAVARLKREPLNYSLLAELNTRPRTTYLAELRNPNPKLDGHGS